MPLEKKIGLTVMLLVGAVGLFLVQGGGRWKLHAINPFRIILCRADGELRPWTKPALWALIGLILAYVWLFV